MIKKAKQMKIISKFLNNNKDYRDSKKLVQEVTDILVDTSFSTLTQEELEGLDQRKIWYPYSVLVIVPKDLDNLYTDTTLDNHLANIWSKISRFDISADITIEQFRQIKDLESALYSRRVYEIDGESVRYSLSNEINISGKKIIYFVCDSEDFADKFPKEANKVCELLGKIVATRLNIMRKILILLDFFDKSEITLKNLKQFYPELL